MVEVAFDVVDEGRVPVTREEHRVAHVVLEPRPGEPVARAGEPVPRVVPEQVAGFAVMIETGEHHVVAQNVPAGPMGRVAVVQPLLLGPAEHGLAGQVGLVAGVGLTPTAGRDGAVLATVDHVDLGQVAPHQAPVHLRPLRARPRRPTDGLVLVPRLVCRRAPYRDGSVAVGAVGVGVVVDDLVIVPGDGEREARVRGPQVGVGLVQRVLHPPTIQTAVRRLSQHVRGADPAIATVSRDAALVDVVTQVQDHVEVLLGHVPVGRIEAAGPVLTGRECQGQSPGARADSRGGTGAAHRRHLVAVSEAVEPLGVRRQPCDLDVHRVCELGKSPSGSPADNSRERLVAGHLPLDRHPPGRHAPARLERTGHQPRPQHHTVRQRVPAGHAEPEHRITARHPWAGLCRSHRELCGGGKPGHPPDGHQEAATIQQRRRVRIDHGGSCGSDGAGNEPHLGPPGPDPPALPPE